MRVQADENCSLKPVTNQRLERRCRLRFILRGFKCVTTAKIIGRFAAKIKASQTAKVRYRQRHGKRGPHEMNCMTCLGIISSAVNLLTTAQRMSQGDQRKPGNRTLLATIRVPLSAPKAKESKARLSEEESRLLRPFETCVAQGRRTCSIGEATADAPHRID